jgi:tetratricopeptide (TPR) repeat protein
MLTTMFKRQILWVSAIVPACAIILFAAGCTGAPTKTAASVDPSQPRLYDGFGHYHRASSTHFAEAQRWFDQGMQLLYGFNHDEAIRSFRHAASLDPNFAFAWWGVAYAYGLHINNPVMSEIQSRRAWEAAQEALARIEHASPVERDLILAVAKRYAMPIPEDRQHLDMAYAEAMEDVWRKHPNDPDVGALFAESLMNLQPWDLWTRDFQPKGRTLEIVAVLERVMELDENHPGANHFYIHAVEASPEPERGLAAADRLGSLVPGSGHLVHMPAHIYARIGRWADASDANVRAIEADRAYFAVAPPPEFYSLYYVHNIHFLAWAAMMEGRQATAMQAARELERDIPESFLREWTFIADGFTPVTYHVMIRFGRWNDILAEPEPEDYRFVNRASRHYARGVALAALGRTAEARRELESFERVAAMIPDDWLVGQNTAHDVMQVARHMLRGELAYREGKLDEAFATLRAGAELEDQLAYDEPPGWMQPVRHALGALLMAEGRAAEAEQVYRDDLEKFPDNGWSLLGLEQALRAQGRTKDADQVHSRLTRAWQRADVRPLASCYCHPDARTMGGN